MTHREKQQDALRHKQRQRNVEKLEKFTKAQVLRECGLEVAVIAERLGISKSTASRWSRGEP